MLSCTVQALNESIVKHEADLSEVKRLGSELRQLAIADETRLDSELQTITDRYKALRSQSDQRLSKMKELPAILNRFYVSHETIVSCVQQLETELLQGDIQPGPEAELHLQVSLVFHPFSVQLSY